jgi:hypothetical protein
VPEFAVDDDLKDLILSTVEASLDAQLRAVRRLRHAPAAPSSPPRQKRLSQVDMAFDVLNKARSPLHVSELLARIRSQFGAAVDRDSLVSSLAKKIARGDRFRRAGKNTVALRSAQP